MTADVHGYGPTQHLPEWRPHGSYTNAYGEKRRRYRCGVCDGTQVEGRANRPGPRPLLQRRPFDRFWEEVELDFARVGLPQAIENGCTAAHVSRRTVAKWLKERRFPGAYIGGWMPTARRQLLEQCLDVGRIKEKSFACRAWHPDDYEAVREDKTLIHARSMQFNAVGVWSTLLIARSAVSIVQGRPLAPWMLMAPEVSEPWLSLILDFQPPQRGSATGSPLAESGLRYMLWLNGEWAEVRIGTRRRTLLLLRRQLEVPTRLYFNSFLPLSPAGAYVQGDDLRIPIVGLRPGAMASPYFRVPRRWSAALAQV